MCKGLVVLGIVVLWKNEKKKKKLWWLGSEVQKQGVRDASGEVSKNQDTGCVKILAFS